MKDVQLSGSQVDNLIFVFYVGCYFAMCWESRA